MILLRQARSHQKGVPSRIAFRSAGLILKLNRALIEGVPAARATEARGCSGG